MSASKLHQERVRLIKEIHALSTKLAEVQWLIDNRNQLSNNPKTPRRVTQK